MSRLALGMLLLVCAGVAQAQVRPPKPLNRRILVGVPLEPEQRAETFDALRSAGHTPVTRLPFLVAIDAPRAAMDTLRTLPHVRWVEEDETLWVEKRQTVDCFSEQWPLQATPGFPNETNIGVEDAWLATTGFFTGSSDRVRVAVVDDGIEPLHPEFFGRFLMAVNLSGDGLIAEELAPRDDHGTQTAGVIASARDGLGVTGVCPDCALLSVRLLGDGGPSDLYRLSSLYAAEAIAWAVDNGAAVINNSWGPPDGNPNTPEAPRTRVELPDALDDALTYAVTQGRDGLGTVVVWSAGNGGEPIAYDAYASDPRVIAVGSIDASARRARYSDWGSALDLVTPSSGNDEQPAIITTDRLGALGGSAINEGACAINPPCSEVCLEDFTTEFGGTSASAAHVSGAAALLIARYPSLTAPQVIEALRLSARPLDALGERDGFSPRYGFGRLDVATALSVAGTASGDLTRAYDMCGNQRDDDGDNEVDESCAPCSASGPEICDGIDNDCDGFVDPGYTCQPTDRGFCASCERSSDCAERLRCRGSLRQPGKFCLPRCDGGETCPNGTECRDFDVCDLSADADAVDCYEVMVRQEPAAVYDPNPAPPAREVPRDEESGGCAAFAPTLLWVRRRPRREPG